MHSSPSNKAPLLFPLAVALSFLLSAGPACKDDSSRRKEAYDEGVAEGSKRYADELSGVKWKVKVKFCGQTLWSNDWKVECHREEVDDLGALEQFHRLQSLDLSATSVTDLRPLAHVTTLERVTLSYTPVSNLSPLATLNKLETLAISYTEVKSLEPLRKLPSLRTLFASEARIADVSPLRGLSNLSNIILRGNPIEDVSALAGLQKIEHLDLSCTNVKDIEPLLALPTTTWINLDDNGQVSAESCKRLQAAAASSEVKRRCNPEGRIPGMTHEDRCMKDGPLAREFEKNEKASLRARAQQNLNKH